MYRSAIIVYNVKINYYKGAELTATTTGVEGVEVTLKA